ncbi:putative lipoprotein [Kosakonia radicincitans YD4]|nr:putative lipoprotein [Kosakonia radicincitans YD4]
MKSLLMIIAVLACTALNGCASYNDHIRACDGPDVSTVHLALDYLPIGAALDNGTCAVTGNAK